MTKVWLVDDPSAPTPHKFDTMKSLLEFLEGPDFDGDPYDEVVVYEAQRIEPLLDRNTDEDD